MNVRCSGASAGDETASFNKAASLDPLRVKKKKMRRIWQSSKVTKIEVRVPFSFLSLRPEDVVYAR
jgi:hypothetical protein